jgi:hypothetical protein
MMLDAVMSTKMSSAADVVLTTVVVNAGGFVFQPVPTLSRTASVWPAEPVVDEMVTPSSWPAMPVLTWACQTRLTASPLNQAV